MKISILDRAKKKKFIAGLAESMRKETLYLLRPDNNMGGGLTGEVYLLQHKNKKWVVRICDSEERAKFYESVSKKLSKDNVLPKLIGRDGKNVFYEYLGGRDLKGIESSKIFEQIGFICAKINNLKYKGDINLNFKKQLNELSTGGYRKFTSEEMEIKRARRPKEIHDRKRIRALITKMEMEEIGGINKELISKTNAVISLDAFDVSPANFRLNKGRVYFVDIDAIKPRITGIGIAKCFFGWAKNERQRESFLKGYSSVLKDNFLTEEYMDLLNLHFLIQALHDRVKIGRDYKTQYKKLKTLLRKYRGRNLE